MAQSLRDSHVFVRSLITHETTPTMSQVALQSTTTSFTITTPFYQYLAHVGLKPLKIIKCCVEACGAEAVSTFFRTLGESHQSFDSLRHLLLWCVLGATWRATGSMPSSLPECGAEVRLFAAVLGDASVATVRALMAASGDIDVRDQLLHCAQSAEMVLFLVNEVGCLVNAPLQGNTPLRSAALNGNVAVASQLVNAGASSEWLEPELRAILAVTPRTELEVALCKVRLVACGSGESRLRIAIQLLLDSRGDLFDSVMRVLLDDGDQPGEKLLVWLAGVGGAAALMVRLLAYAPQSEETVNRALRAACVAGNADMARALIGEGASAIVVIDSIAGVRLSSEICDLLLHNALSAPPMTMLLAAIKANDQAAAVRALHRLEKPLNEDDMALLAAVEGGRIAELSRLIETLRAHSFEQVHPMLTAAALASNDLLSFVIWRWQHGAQLVQQEVWASRVRRNARARRPNESIADASFRHMVSEHECCSKSSVVLRKAASIVEQGDMSLVDWAIAEAHARRCCWVPRALATVAVAHTGHRLPPPPRLLELYNGRDDAAFREHYREAEWYIYASLAAARRALSPSLHCAAGLAPAGADHGSHYRPDRRSSGTVAAVSLEVADCDGGEALA
jgi:hypothetical protein